MKVFKNRIIVDPAYIIIATFKQLTSFFLDVLKQTKLINYIPSNERDVRYVCTEITLGNEALTMMQFIVEKRYARGYTQFKVCTFTIEGVYTIYIRDSFSTLSQIRNKLSPMKITSTSQ